MPELTDGNRRESRLLVEFASRQHAADAGSDELPARSDQAMQAALSQVREVVERLSRLHAEMPAGVKQLQIDFGIKLDWEAGALLAKDQREATISVKLTWDRDSMPGEANLTALMEEVPAPGTEVPITPTGLFRAIETQAGETTP